ncbi:Neuronal acetylcholine receptor subunit beta-3 [Liparis tanakae]|uniref:Neuronal acetylcholine receptor subunit beta-3 n=1 Tax=Liparis tanakae TaxID=230148 RepID=A0A4Z2ETP5_9TELE|nr:Neuronal acetylcholine receptor subunit beta-3 [Liparis tanakae]
MTPLGTLALLALMGVGGAQTDCSYFGLLTHLNLTTGNAMQTALRPVRNWTTTTHVQLDLVLYGILGVDEKSQTVTTHVWIQTRWSNEFLSWTPSGFCGINHVLVPRAAVWLPDVIITEDASDTGSISYSPVVRVTSRGRMVSSLRQRLTSTCTFITISRKPMLYVIIFIVPLFYFVLLDVASFFINEARGEKLSFKVTVLLSISVLLLILKDLLPSTEAELPMIAMYCCVIFVLVGLSLLEAMLVSFLIDLDGCCKNPEAPEGEAVQLEADRPDAPELHEAGGTPEKSSPPPSRPGDLLELILQEVKKVGQEARGRDKDEKRPGRYRRLAEIIDSVFFVLYLLCICSFLMYMLLSAYFQM